MLRETIMGPELFDKAFKEYAQRWAFHHPKPADFFRTMEDASAVDLDWFWRGWFYTNDRCDQSIEKVKWYQVRKDQNSLENKGKTVKKETLLLPVVEMVIKITTTSAEVRSHLP